VKKNKTSAEDGNENTVPRIIEIDNGKLPRNMSPRPQSPPFAYDPGHDQHKTEKMITGRTAKMMRSA